MNELKFQRITLDNIVKLSEEVKQGYSREGQNNVDLHMDGPLIFILRFFTLILFFKIYFDN